MPEYRSTWTKSDDVFGGVLAQAANNELPPSSGVCHRWSAAYRKNPQVRAFPYMSFSKLFWALAYGHSSIYFVTEKPTIRKVELSGNVNIEQEKIRERLTVKVQTIVNEATIKETVRNIRKLYQEKGYYFARVEAVLKEGARKPTEHVMHAFPTASPRWATPAGR